MRRDRQGSGSHVVAHLHAIAPDLAVEVVPGVSAISAAVARLGWPLAVRVGAGMVPRGEVGMVVAQIGLALGVIPKPVYGVVVFMAIATTLIAPPLITMAYRGAKKEVPVEDFQIG